MSCQRDFDDFQFQEPQMDFGLLRSWVASSTLAILLPNEPLPKNNLQKTFPRFNFNKFQPIQTGSFVLTIFHVCRPHLHSCLGSWHLPTRKRHISSPFFLMVYQLRWWDFPLIIKGLASHKAIKIWRSWDLLSYLHLNNKADGNKPSSETNIMETLPNPSRLALYQLIHTWNNCSETSNLNSLIFSLQYHPTTFTVGNMAFFNIHPNQLPHPPHFVKQGTHQDPCGHSNDTQGQCQG